MSSTTKRNRSVAATADTGKQRLRLWLRLLRTTRSIETELRERMRVRFDSTLPRFDVMAALYREARMREAQSAKPQGLTMTALSRQLLVSNGNATVIVDRLEKDGLVARSTAAGDRRSFVVSLTPQGLKQFRTMAAAHEGWIAEILSDIAPAHADLLLDIFDRRHALEPKDRQ